MVIAIDGLSSCGKSTLARDLAQRLHIEYIDSGAMYRAATLYFIENNVDIENEQALSQALDNISIRFENGRILLNDRDVSSEIRTPAVADLVSPVAALSKVRRKLVELQQSYGDDGSVVMDGRDIGTVVFPNADYKFFITADLKTRTQRRYEELIQKGTPLSYEEVAENLSTRDHIDSTREDSPLIQANDAVLIDTSHLTREEQLNQVLGLVCPPSS